MAGVRQYLCFGITRSAVQFLSKCADNVSDSSKRWHFWTLVNEMPIDIDPPDSSAILRLVHLANAHKLTTYDAAYLELAKRLHVPLATGDKQLIQAASECRVDVLTASAA